MDGKKSLETRFNKKSLYHNFKRLNANLPVKPLQYFEYYFLEYIGFPPKQKLRFNVQLKIADETDLPQLNETFQCKAKKFKKRLKNGHLILLAKAEDGKIVGYEMVDLSHRHYEEHSGLQITIPEDSIYLYDAYILPEYRLKGVWLGLKNLLADIMVEKRRRRLMTFVDWDNTISLKTHLQFGFKIYENVKIWKIFGKAFSHTVEFKPDPKTIRQLILH